MFAGNLQTYQHSRRSLKWIRNSSCCASERNCPGDPPRDKKNIIRQACSKHTGPIYRHWLYACVCVCVCAFWGWRRGKLGASERGTACMCLKASLVDVRVCFFFLFLNLYLDVIKGLKPFVWTHQRWWLIQQVLYKLFYCINCLLHMNLTDLVYMWQLFPIPPFALRLFCARSLYQSAYKHGALMKCLYNVLLFI